MNENRKQIEEANEVEGHGARFNGALPVEGDEVEGHGISSKHALPDEGDDEGTEGHGRVSVV